MKALQARCLQIARSVWHSGGASSRSPRAAPADATRKRRAVEGLSGGAPRSTGGPTGLSRGRVLLTLSQAYKVKKPLRLPFLDFPMSALRRQFCAEELRLDRRLALSI